MNIKQTIRTLVLGGLLLVPIVAFANPQSAKAATTCGGVETSIINCGGSKDATKTEDNGLWQLLLITINILTAGVGVLALAGIVYGGILYTSSGGSPEQVKKARAVFTNVVIGVIAFGGMYALLNFIVPGGIFN